MSVLLLFSQRKLSVIQVMFSSRQAFRLGVELRNTLLSSGVKEGVVASDDMAKI